MRRLLHVAMTRARKSVVLSWAEDAPRRAAVALLRGGAGRGGRDRGVPRGAALRPRRGPARDVPDDAGRGARLGLARSGPPGRDAARHLHGRCVGERPLPRVAEGGRARRAHEGGPDGRRGAARDQRAPAPGVDSRGARAVHDLGARRVPARRGGRHAPARACDRRRRRAVARRVHPAARRRPDAVRVRHRDLPALPAEVQVRARLPDPAGADDQPALRDRRPPGARALPRGRRRLARHADAAVRGVVAAERLRRLERRPPVPREGGRGARPATGSSTRSAPASRCGSSAGSRSSSARISCAGASTAWTSCPTARSS